MWTNGEAPTNQKSSYLDGFAQLSLFFRSKDIFGNRLLNRTSASHGSDLLYLFGPEMYRKFLSQGFETFRFVTRFKPGRPAWLRLRLVKMGGL